MFRVTVSADEGGGGVASFVLFLETQMHRYGPFTLLNADQLHNIVIIFKVVLFNILHINSVYALHLPFSFFPFC